MEEGKRINRKTSKKIEKRTMRVNEIEHVLEV